MRLAIHLALVSTLVWTTTVVAATVTVDVTPSHAVNTFSPVQALGAGVDGQLLGLPEKMFSPANLTTMLDSGWGRVSYRLYTELSVQHWHWNPTGSWSDGAAGQGYWTSSGTPGASIVDSFGYRLPHRGFTNDQGNDDDYSRLDDGDDATYWKSNPYLTSAYTGEPDASHPQWVVVDLGQTRSVDAIRLAWVEPHATDYQVQYWTGADAIFDPAHGAWQTFPGGGITAATGGTVTLTLAPVPITVEYVRVLMTASSHTCDSHGAADSRNCVGYALGEIGIGTNDGGSFIDRVSHSPDLGQTLTYASSVDPWHTPANRVTDQEQPGLDFIFTNGITRGLPTQVPVAMVYGVPEDAAAEIAYLEARGYPIASVELGEEPDGQYMLPEDYGALYLQWATAIHAVDPSLKLGGPVFQGVNPVFPGVSQDVPVWPNGGGNTSWLTRFLAYLSAHGRLADLAFMSFENYPLDGCHRVWQRLFEVPTVTQQLLDTWRADGLPPTVPMLVTEYNMSFDTPKAMQDIVGALWHADFLGSFLTAGGSGAYYYEYEPTQLGRGQVCRSYGALGMFAADADNQITAPTAQFFSTSLVTKEWAQPVDATHTVFPAASDARDARGNVLVTAYALHRPDGQYALLLVNKSKSKPVDVSVSFQDGTTHAFTGTVTMRTLGRDNYRWRPHGVNGFPSPDGPPTTTSIGGGAGTVYTLPRASITVLRGTIF